MKDYPPLPNLQRLKIYNIGYFIHFNINKAKFKKNSTSAPGHDIIIRKKYKLITQ